MVTLTVAVIAYSRYRFLDEAVKSIAFQTRQPDNVVVFTDNRGLVRKILEKYGVKAEIYQEPHLSLPATYARIGEVAGTEYVLPLEDDDVFKPNKLEAVEKYCKGYPLIKHAADFIDEESRPINVLDNQPANSLVITRENAWSHHLSYPYHAWPSTFAIKTALLRKYKEDLFKRALKSSSSGYLINGVLKADRVISTLPLKDAPSIFDLSDEARKVSERLDYNSVVVVGLGLRKQAPKQHWIYVPDKRIIFHRYAWISNYGEDAMPGRAVLVAEVTIPPTWEIDLEEIKSRVVHDLIEIGVIKENEVDVVKAWIHRYGYPIYTLTHGEDIDIITQELTQKGILTFGRWGNWQYWNTDRIFEEARRLAL
jgi:glycosyltransferase involved in cell wall biosynthesis